MKGPKDRRDAPRYSPAAELAQVGWWDGPRFHVAAARLRDISSGGAAVAVPGGLATPPALWFCVLGATTTEWVQANLVAAEPADPADGTHRVRLAFPEPCPYETFKAAVWGTTLVTVFRAEPAPTVAAPDAGPEAPDLPLQFRPPEPEDCEAPAALPDAPRAEPGPDRRVAWLPWVAALLLSLAVAALVGRVAIERLGDLRRIEQRLGGPAHSR